ncbi:MAG TPA: fasciclin domain-containing protein [Nitriliruptoraceae bacterium]|nr:fasciclin domain-containing protein [Nitriliruptoraceae bacterium]
MRTPFRTSAVAGVAAVAMLLTACGGSADEDTSSDTATEAMTEAMTDDMTTEAMTDDMTEMASEAMTDEMATEGESALTMQPVGDACDQIPTDGEGSSEGMADDPVATAASANPLLSTLVTAVGEAGLVDTLNGAEALTVFAPIDPAFDDLDPATLDAAMADPEGLLTTVLTLHVAEGQMDAAALTDAGTVTTLNGADLEFDGEAMTVSSGAVTANVVCGNVQTDNATVHLIDAVLLPAG